MNSQPYQTLVQEVITTNADYHSRLCSTISDLAYVRVAKEEQVALIGDLRERLASSNRLVEELTKRTAKERKEHESLRESKGRRFMHGIVGQTEKFEGKREKEEREYVEALEVEMKERENSQALKSQLDQAEGYTLKLDERQKVYDATVSERDRLYANIFDGSLKDLQEQAALKDALVEAQHNYNRLQQLLSDEHEASEYLSNAIKKADRCENHISDAQNNSGYEMFPVAPTAFAKVEEAVKDAQATAIQVATLVETAMRLSSSVKPVGEIDIQETFLLNGLTFANFLTDISFAAKLREAKAQTLQIQSRLIREQGAASSRATRTVQSLKEAADKVDEYRGALTDLRREIFDNYNTRPGCNREVNSS